MPHTVEQVVPKPTIEALGDEVRGQPGHITKTTLIKISTGNPLHKIYFTTDGTVPDAFNRLVSGREVTHKYKAPFGLKPGARTINAIAYTRNGKGRSPIATRTFEVVYIDTDLSEIGELDEDVASTVRSGLSANGSSRYMQRLKHHLNETVTSSGSDLDFETPRSVRELLDTVETPHSARNGSREEHYSNGNVDQDLNASEYERLAELEEQHRWASEQAEYLRAQEAAHEEAYELAREREDELRRDAADEDYLLTREREKVLYEEHHADLVDQERRRQAWADTGIEYADCPTYIESNDYNQGREYYDDSKTCLTDFFYSTDNRLGSSYDRQRQENYRPLNGSGRLTDYDYGITGVVTTTAVSSPVPRNESLHISRDIVPITGQCGSTPRSHDAQIHAEYRRQVDSELLNHVRTNHQPGYADDHRAAILRESQMYEYRDDGHRPITSEVESLFERGGRYPTRYYSRSPSPHGRRSRSPSPYRRRSRSRERNQQGILKRGRSLERARSRERERERSQSRDQERRRSRSRSRERLGVRRESLSPTPRYQRDLEYPTPRAPPREDPRYTNLRDTQMSLEEIDARLSQLEESDSSLNDPRKSRVKDKELENKMKKDSANLKKSNANKSKKQQRPPTPPSSVSSSLSSSSSSSLNEGNKDQQAENLSVNGKKIKKPKAIEPPAVIVPKTVKPSKPIRSKDEPKKAGKKKAEGALNFFNDSGTQINFWGMSPDEITQRLQENPELREALTVLNDTATGQSANGSVKGSRTGSVRGSVNGSVRGSSAPTTETESSEIDEAVNSFFMTEPRRRPAGPIKAARQAQAHAEMDFDDDMDGQIEPISVNDNRSTPVGPSQQADQHGIFSNIGKKVKDFFTGGEKSKGGATTFTRIDYASTKKKCLKKKELWEDPDFPADDSSLFYNEAPQLHPFEWKRPHEICKNPQYIVGGASRFDVKQGVLGNCWLLAAIASLAGHEKLLYHVIYPEQSFQDEYAGIFRCQFWQYGEWVDVCVDDRLPTKNGKLVYMHSQQEDEFWSPLIEKAYAKLNGCYENLSGGLTSEAMTDFCGGLVECFNFREELPDNMFQILNKANERGSLMGCSIDASPDQMEQQLDNGLIIGHAYSITDVKSVAGDNGNHQLVRVRNPWGNHCEWTGAWSDGSKEWKSIPDKTRTKLGITKGHDGEFWMSIRDFTTHFQRVEVCNQDRSSSGAWESTFINNSWIKKVSAGGCRNFPETYATNPQFEITVQDIDDDDEEDVGTIILALLQKDRRRLRPTGGGNLTIGYDIYQVPPKFKGKIEKKHLSKMGPTATSPQYINQREVTGRHRLPVGKYIVMPTTFESNEEADFLLRVYSEKEAGLMESDIPTSVNTKITAKTMAAAHSAPGVQRTSHEAEQQFRARAGEDLEVDAYELLDILNTTFTKDFNFGSFNINSCRSMVAIRDTDATGMLGLEEFKSLWDDLVMWKQVFKTHDKDENGFFSSFELREALKSVGYNVSNVTFKNVVMRYSDREGHIQFNDFLDCLIRLKTLFDLYERTGQQGEGSSAMSLDNFIATLMYT